MNSEALTYAITVKDQTKLLAALISHPDYDNEKGLLEIKSLIKIIRKKLKKVDKSLTVKQQAMDDLLPIKSQEDHINPYGT